MAIKRISDVFRVETDTRRFLREIYILRRLKHPNVVQVRDVFFAGAPDTFNELYIVFEVRRMARGAVFSSVMLLAAVPDCAMGLC